LPGVPGDTIFVQNTGAFLHVIPASSVRLTFRSWTDEDTALAEALRCDPEVTQYFGGAMTREQAHHRLDIERENRLGGASI
jgi:hypothetical protein